MCVKFDVAVDFGPTPRTTLPPLHSPLAYWHKPLLKVLSHICSAQARMRIRIWFETRPTRPTPKSEFLSYDLDSAVWDLCPDPKNNSAKKTYLESRKQTQKVSPMHPHS